ncbi:hypothetical protein FRC17_006731 [Serendipita sp. 399]|nr:hypothetical protein FRC17_006731 [Serendipita sp. 399]
MAFVFPTAIAIILAVNGVAAKPRRGGGSLGGSSSQCYDEQNNVVPCPVNKTAIIAGVVVGAVVVIAVIAIAFILWRRRRARARSFATLNTPAPDPSITEKGHSVDHTETSIKMPEPAHSTVPTAAPGTYAPPSGPPPKVA